MCIGEPTYKRTRRPDNLCIPRMFSSDIKVVTSCKHLAEEASHRTFKEHTYVFTSDSVVPGTFDLDVRGTNYKDVL